MGNNGDPPDHVDLPESAKRGQSVDTVEVRNGKVFYICPVCGRTTSAKQIITENACEGGHTLDLVLLQGESARRGK